MLMSDGNLLYKWVLAISSLRDHLKNEALTMKKGKFSVADDQEHLLLSRTQIKNKKVGALVPFLKWCLRILIWVIFIAWATLIFLFPAEFVGGFIEKFAESTSGTLFGATGSLFLLFSGPILFIVVLAIIHIFISGEEDPQVKKGRTSPRLRLWTFPVLVDGPFGVVVAAEFIGICIFGVYVLWALYAYTLRNLKLLSEFDISSLLKSSIFLELTGLRLGSVGMFCLAFLFLPISRGSVLLRFIDIPFEQATRYHVWLGHLTMWLFTVHGLCYVVAYAMQGRLLQDIFSWASIGVAVLPGVISLLAGLLMWVTSLSPVRKQQFELFFYTHQLYIVFIVFFALHVGDFIFSISSAGIFLFMLDRFLRFCQSRRIVKVVSATSLPGGTVELVFSKPSDLNYNALSFIFIQIRELSWLQWHPFSVSSSPLDGKNHISVLVKVLGEWTSKLRGNIEDTSGLRGETEGRPNATLTASIEGPYGHESPYHLTYENLLLIAGGIGVSPFFAILSDILHRKSEGKPCLPKNVVLIWAVKKSDELPLLSTLNMDAICPVLPNNLNLDIRIYVTREFEPPLEEGSVEKTMDSHVFPISTSNSSAMSVLVGTGNQIWSGLYVVSAIVGFIVLIALVDMFYINPYGISSWWYKGLIFITCMAVSVPLFGGLVISLWHLWEKKAADEEEEELEGSKEKTTMDDDELSQRRFIASKRITYGSRPDFGEVFGSLSEQWGRVDVGVIVCGPPTLQTSVARECRSRSLKRGPENTIFHFNSHSFDL